MKNNSFDDGKGIRKGKRTGTSEGLSQTSVSSQKVSRQFFRLKGKKERKRDSAVDWQIKEESDNFKGNTLCLDGKIVEQSHLFLSREAIFITSLR